LPDSDANKGANCVVNAVRDPLINYTKISSVPDDLFSRLRKPYPAVGPTC